VTELIANAESWDPTQTEFVLILLCSAGIAVVCLMVAVIILLAKRGAHRHAQQLSTAAMFWGLITIATMIYATMSQLSWAKENFLELLSGYGNPQETTPPLPWIFWSILVAIYLLLLGWTVWKKA
jgi:hypothetical protein